MHLSKFSNKKKLSMKNSVILCLICAYDIANVGSIKVSVNNVDILLISPSQILFIISAHQNSQSFRNVLISEWINQNLVIKKFISEE